MADLTNTLTSSVTIGTTVHSLTVSETITLTDDNVVHQTLSIPHTAETDVAKAGSVQPGGLTDLKYAMIINRDGTNFVRLRVKDDGAHAFDIKLKAGEFAVIHSRELNVSATAGAFASFSNLDTIAVQADTATCDVEIFLAY